MVSSDVIDQSKQRLMNLYVREGLWAMYNGDVVSEIWKISTSEQDDVIIL